MDILAQRKAMGNLTGVILVNGKPVTRRFIRQTAYVPQDDNFIATMTTQETMRFYADIVLPQHWTRKQRRDRVGEVLGAVGLASQVSSRDGSIKLILDMPQQECMYTSLRASWLWSIIPASCKHALKFVELTVRLI
jgi:hypothetical protein